MATNNNHRVIAELMTSRMKSMGLTWKDVVKKTEELEETNPVLYKRRSRTSVHSTVNSLKDEALEIDARSARSVITAIYGDLKNFTDHTGIDLNLSPIDQQIRNEKVPLYEEESEASNTLATISSNEWVIPPLDSDFAVRICSRSLFPIVHKGQILYFRAHEAKAGDLCAFIHRYKRLRLGFLSENGDILDFETTYARSQIKIVGICHSLTPYVPSHKELSLNGLGSLLYFLDSQEALSKEFKIKNLAPASKIEGDRFTMRLPLQTKSELKELARIYDMTMTELVIRIVSELSRIKYAESQEKEL